MAGWEFLLVMEEALSLTIPDRLDALDALRRALRCWLDRAGVERETAEDVVLATWEVCANAVEHPLDTEGRGRHARRERDPALGARGRPRHRLVAREECANGAVAAWDCGSHAR